MFTFIKRIILFLSTNFLVLLGAGLLMNFFHMDIWVKENAGVDYRVLLFLSLIFGIGGSLINLLFSRYTMKKLYGIQIINNSNDPDEMALVSRVKEIAKIAKVPVPQIGYYNSEEVNAFATGFSRHFALVAFSSNLFRKLDSEEIDGVIAHELAHIKNGDMVTMTLINGLINTFVLFFSRVIGISLIKKIKASPYGFFLPSIFLYYIIIAILDSVLMFFGKFVINYFSRKREFSADLLAVDWVGPSMEQALKKLELLEMPRFTNTMDSPFKILGQNSISAIFSTHPNMKDRINKVHKKLIKRNLATF